MIINTKDYAAGSEILKLGNGKPSGCWLLGLDMGFSAVKGYGPGLAFTFPNCALLTGGLGFITEYGPADIVIQEGSETWLVGQRALEVMNAADVMNLQEEMTDRNRYDSRLFAALVKAAIGLSICEGKGYTAGEEIVIQTGLPPKYKDPAGENDTPRIKDALAGDYDFRIKVGNGPFRHLKFTVLRSNVYVMDQPMGALFSTLTGADGSQSAEDISILERDVLVLDPGFKTLDTFVVRHGVQQKNITYDNMGMHEILSRTAAEIRQMTGQAVTVPVLQQCLPCGKIKTFDRRTRRSGLFEFGGILAEKTDEVFGEALAKLDSVYDYFLAYDFLVVTGGTAAAWEDSLKEHFSGMSDTLQVLYANRYEPELSSVYGNVRGYYYFRRINSRKR